MTGSVWLLGHPVSHSRSPAIHNSAFQHLALDLVYLTADVKSERLDQAIRGLSALGALGANVTVPHKQAVKDSLDSLSPEAELLGAVNTVVIQDQSLVGHNTDGVGWLRSWDEEVGLPLEGRQAVIMGSGGAARAIFWALASRRVQSVTVLNRTVSKAEALVEELGPHFPATKAAVGPLDQLSRGLGEGTVLVNTTTVGMVGQPGSLSLPPRLADDLVVADLVYNPEQTELLKAAQQAGARCLGGLGMLIHQAAAAFELLTGKAAPIEVMRVAARGRSGR